MSHSYGFIPGPIHPFAPKLSLPRAAAPFPAKFKPPSEILPPFPEQAYWNACVAHGIPYAMRSDIISQYGRDLELSRMFLWWEGRKPLGAQTVNSGMMIHDAVNVASQIGVPPEDDWDYTDQHAYVQPSVIAYEDASSEEAFIVEEIDTPGVTGRDLVDACKLCLTNNVLPILGFTVYDSFEADDKLRSGIAPVPREGEQIQGGHCVNYIGWDDGVAGGSFLCSNWWGHDWGMNGSFWMPYTFITQLGIVSDVWRINRVASVQTSNR